MARLNDLIEVDNALYPVHVVAHFGVDTGSVTVVAPAHNTNEEKVRVAFHEKRTTGVSLKTTVT